MPSKRGAWSRDELRDERAPTGESSGSDTWRRRRGEYAGGSGVLDATPNRRLLAERYAERAASIGDAVRTFATSASMKISRGSSMYGDTGLL